MTELDDILLGWGAGLSPGGMGRARRHSGRVGAADVRRGPPSLIICTVHPLYYRIVCQGPLPYFRPDRSLPLRRLTNPLQSTTDYTPNMCLINSGALRAGLPAGNVTSGKL